jgi:hypothetical protein
MPDDFDPARRLYDILSASPTQDASQPSRVVWARLLGRSPDDRTAIYRGLALLAELVNEVEEAVKACPDADTKLLLEKLPAIRKGIGVMQLEAPFSQVAPLFTEAAVLDSSTTC